MTEEEEGDSNNVVIVDNNDEKIATEAEAEAFTKKRKKKKEKKSSKKDKNNGNDITEGNGGNVGNGNDDNGNDDDENMVIVSPKKSKKSKKNNGNGGDGGNEDIDEISPPSSPGGRSKKKKKKKKDTAAAASDDEMEELVEALADTDLLSSSPVKPKSAKSKTKPSSKKNIMAESKTKTKTKTKPSSKRNIMAPSSKTNIMAESKTKTKSSSKRNIMAPSSKTNIMTESKTKTKTKPSSKRNIMAPSSKKNIMAESKSKTKTKPSSKRNIMAPSSKTNIMTESKTKTKPKPSSKRNMMAPSSKTNIMTESKTKPEPSSMRNIMAPSSKKNIMAESKSKTKTKPSSKKNIIAESKTKTKPSSMRNIMVPSSKKNIMAESKSKTKASSMRNIMASGSSSQRKLHTASHSDYDKYSIEYFQATLEEIRSKCERKLKLKTKDKDAFAAMCTNYYDIWKEKQENDRLLTELLEGKNNKINNGKNNRTENRTTKQLVEAQMKHAKGLDSTLLKRKKWCIKSALKVFIGVKEDSLLGIENKLVKGAIIAQMTPTKLASFASKSKINEKLLKRLFGDAHLMKEMLLHGGAMKYEYGEAIRIYDDCMEVEQQQDNGKGKTKTVSSKKSKKKSKDDNEKNEVEAEVEVEVGDDNNDKWMKVNRKIALACALELASPVYEFDTTTIVDPVERYKHFVEAHKSGELDPSFPFFSVWEMRQIVNCDAPNEQMTWCRKMVMSYVPHLTCITDATLRYVYMLEYDVRIRKPNWTAKPRTYPMVLSGGGNESVNSWFGRFLLKSFGLPSWGSKFRRKEGYTRWTPDGWVALNGANWDDYSWKGKTGKDFKIEVEARNKAPSEEYFKRLITLQCLADIIDEGDPSSIPENEKDVFHADRMWRSMSIVSMSLLFQTEPGVIQKYDRKGETLVVTNCEKYLEKFQNDKPDADITYDDDAGIVIIPASRHNGFADGNIVVIESFTGGKQLNFMAGGIVEYEIPDDVPIGTYTLTCEVCTVSSNQAPLMVQSGDAGDALPVEMKIPYTKGEWQTTDGVEIAIESGTTLRFSRPKGSLGVAVKKFVLSS